MGSLIAEAAENLATHGGRMTAQRRLILETLEQFPSHPTAEEIYEQARQKCPDLNLSTVYRTLRWLEGEGLVNARVFEEERRQERFDPVVSEEMHHHFVCKSCKQVVEFNDPLIDSIQAKFEEASGAKVDSSSVVLYGLCPACRKIGEGKGFSQNKSAA